MANEVTPSNLLKAMARPASTTVSTFVAAQTLAIDETKDIGDFVSTEDEELEIEVTAEPWGKYDPTELREVFYPIHLGEILNERDLSTNSVLFCPLATRWTSSYAYRMKSFAACRIVSTFAISTRMSAAKQLLKALEAPRNAGIMHRELVRAIEVPANLRTEDFYLGDFGLVMKVGDSVAQPGYPPLEFCSPERLHGKDPSFACDMWSYMIISFIYQGHPPFHDPRIRVRTSFNPMPIRLNENLCSPLCKKVFIYSPEERLTAT
ncbi:uncharacterized protein An16g05480 [Aspergillus niger]|uniref:Contig An16c0190, genomic contig n=2 Tax=Aspergillus niger TaxID=5061 RepID=A2R814_ASPNC|nr:uncharacterized protein An16g05480 [Aspergillus niger]CAK46888.1 unnamed protein product [Aspergillus niger]